MSAGRSHAITVVDRDQARRTDRGFLHHLHRGRWVPPFIRPAAITALQASWDTGPDDIFVATAQKVGTHLTKRFLVELFAEAGAFGPEHPCATRDIGHGAVPWPEVKLSQDGEAAWQAHLAAAPAGPRIWYIHSHTDDLPFRAVHPASRFVVCLRDPKAVAVSQYFFYRNHPLLEVDPHLTLPEFVALFLGGDLYFGDYFEHVRAWLADAPARLPADAVLYLRYEDLVTAKEQTVHTLADFLLPGFRPTPEALARIVHRTSFAQMKEEMTQNPQTFHFRPEVFFRAGTPDDWKQHLRPDQAAEIDARAAAAWAGLPFALDLLAPRGP